LARTSKVLIVCHYYEFKRRIRGFAVVGAPKPWFSALPFTNEKKPDAVSLDDVPKTDGFGALRNHLSA
jgi:hypothetical protein